MFDYLAILQQHNLSGLHRFYLRNRHVGFVTAPRFELLRHNLPNLFTADSAGALHLSTAAAATAESISAALDAGYRLVRQHEDNFIHSPAEDVAVSLVMDPTKPDAKRTKSNNCFALPYYGAHLNIYSRTADGVKIWLSKRSHKVFTYQGCWEMAVACIIPYSDSPTSAITREAYEEAGLSGSHLNGLKFIKQVDQTFDQIYQHGLHLDRQYYFDLEIPSHINLSPIDQEAEAYVCLGADEVWAMLQDGTGWKHNGAATVLDFGIRHGLYNPPADVKSFLADCLHRPPPLLQD